MNDSEKRRRELLEQARALYSEDGHYRDTPAIHPRYRALYRGLYDEEENEATGTFAIRLVVCVILLAAFITMDMRGQEIAGVSSDRIVQEITTDTDVAEVWRNL